MRLTDITEGCQLERKEEFFFSFILIAIITRMVDVHGVADGMGFADVQETRMAAHINFHAGRPGSGEPLS